MHDKTATFEGLRSRIGAASLILGGVLWMSSLSQQGVTGYGPTEGLSGFMILFFGWFHPAWWANAVTALALVLTFLRHHRYGFWLGCLAIAMSFSALLIEEFPGNNGPIYGLGFGALLWLLSIPLIAIGAVSLGASGERDGNERFSRYRKVMVLFSTMILTIGSVIAIAFGQRLVVNSEEAGYFNSPFMYRTFLKLSPVCRLEQPSPEPLALKTRALEMGRWDASGSGWKPAQLHFLLHAGISPLIFVDREVAATDVTAGVVAVRPRASSPYVTVSTQLVSKRLALGTIRGTRIKLRTNEAVPQTREFVWWEQDRASDLTCPRSIPDYQARGTSSERFVVAAAGDVARGNTFPGERVNPKIFRVVSDEVGPPAKVERALLTESCRGRIEFEETRYPDSLKWSGLGQFGPLFTGAKDTAYFLMLFGEVNQALISCNDKWLVAAAALFHSRAVDILLIERNSMQVRRWLRVDSPSLDGYRALWNIDNVQLIDGRVRLDLSDFGQTKDGLRRTRAELILELDPEKGPKDQNLIHILGARTR